MTLSISAWAIALLPLLLLPAALFWGAPAIAVVSEIIGLVQRKPFPARAARQISRLALWGHGVCWLLLLSAWGVGGVPEGLRQSPLLPLLGGLPVLGTLLLGAYDLTWKQTKDRKGLHLSLGMAANIPIKWSYWLLCAVTLLTFRALPLDSPAFVPPVGSPLWPLASLWLTMSVSLAAGLGLCYLLLRRHRDDWGRDYYRYAAPLLAKWHLLGGIATLVVMCWLFFSLKGLFNLYLPSIMYPGAAAAALLIVAMLLAATVNGNENPMRLKVSMLGIALLTALHAGLVGVAVAETLNRYVPGWSIPTFMPHVLQLLH